MRESGADEAIQKDWIAAPPVAARDDEPNVCPSLRGSRADEAIQKDWIAVPRRADDYDEMMKN